MSGDLISRQAAIDAIEDLKTRYCDRKVVLAKAQDAVNNLSAVHIDLSAYSDRLWEAGYERGKAERKRGKWLPENRTMDAFWVCSSCGFSSKAYTANILYKYCPNCGANMRKPEEGERC